MTGRDTLNIKWSKGSMPELNDAFIDTLYQDHLEKGSTAKTPEMFRLHWQTPHRHWSRRINCITSPTPR